MNPQHPFAIHKAAEYSLFSLPNGRLNFLGLFLKSSL